MEAEFVPSASLDSHTIPMDVKIPLINPSKNPEHFSNGTLKSVVTKVNQPDAPSTTEVMSNSSNQLPGKYVVRSPYDEAKLNNTPVKFLLVSQIKTVAFYQALFSEFLGTMLLTLIITSTGLPIRSKGVPDLHGALASGFAVATLIVGFGHISGAHINPAVTISFLTASEIDIIRTVGYIVVQILGGIFGAVLLRLLAPSHAHGDLGMTTITPGVTILQAVIIEVIITFILCFTVHAICDKRRDDIGGSKAVAVGLAIVIGCLFGGSYTGGSMNPARSFGPALIMDSWENHWVYWVGPIIGSVLAALIYKYALKIQPTIVARSESQLKLNPNKLNHI
jgi:MIP family channel proteins